MSESASVTGTNLDSSTFTVPVVSATEFNNPKTNNYFTNAQGNLIHFHFAYSNYEPAEAVCFFAHGYGGHSNGPVAQEMAKYLNERHIAVFFMDFQGHGYSTGDRAHMTCHTHLTADLIQFIHLILVDEISDHVVVMTAGTEVGVGVKTATNGHHLLLSAAHRRGVPLATTSFDFTNTTIRADTNRMNSPPPDVPDVPDDASVPLSKEWLLRLRTLPFFLMGQSMGGALLNICSNTILDTECFKNTYVGTVTLAPALHINSRPSWVMTEILRYTVAFFYSKGEMPSSQKGNNSLDFSHSVRDPAKIAMFEADTWGNPGAIGYNQPMKWGTALFFLDLHTHATQSFPSMRFPFLILHDPQDKICNIQGSRDMYALAATREEDKKLIEVPDGLHGLLTNQNNMILDHVLDWVRPRMRMVASAGIGGVIGECNAV